MCIYTCVCVYRHKHTSVFKCSLVPLNIVIPVHQPIVIS